MADVTHYAAHATGSGLRAGLARARSAIAGFFRKMQHARMVSVLRQMTPEQLDHVGITRADIPRHAAMLVGCDFDTL